MTTCVGRRETTGTHPLFSVFLSGRPADYWTIGLSRLPACLPIGLLVSLSIRPPVCLSARLSL